MPMRPPPTARPCRRIGASQVLQAAAAASEKEGKKALAAINGVNGGPQTGTYPGDPVPYTNGGGYPNTYPPIQKVCKQKCKPCRDVLGRKKTCCISDCQYPTNKYGLYLPQLYNNPIYTYSSWELVFDKGSVNPDNTMWARTPLSIQASTGGGGGSRELHGRRSWRRVQLPLLPLLLLLLCLWPIALRFGCLRPPAAQNLGRKPICPHSWLAGKANSLQVRSVARGHAGAPAAFSPPSAAPAFLALNPSNPASLPPSRCLWTCTTRTGGSSSLWTACPSRCASSRGWVRVGGMGAAAGCRRQRDTRRAAAPPPPSPQTAPPLTPLPPRMPPSSPPLPSDA